MIPPKSSEHEFVGGWHFVDGEVVADDVAIRISWLVENHLERVGSSALAGDWEVVFKDPNDGRYWLLDYPHSEQHGGGPPRLRVLSPTDASRILGS